VNPDTILERIKNMRKAPNKAPLMDGALRMNCGTLRLTARIAITDMRRTKENMHKTLQDKKGCNNRGRHGF
jgi:hypothetical protein